MTPERFRKLKRVLDRRQPDLTVLAENVHKTHNIAAVLRTCDAVGIFRMHAVSDNDEFARHRLVTGGSRKWVETQQHPDVNTAIALLKSSGYQVLAAHISDSSVDYREPDYTKPTAVLLGSELVGVSSAAAAVADAHVVVPMHGLVESLNVSVAVALILFEAARQREAAGLYTERRLDDATWSKTLFEWCYPEVARRCRSEGLPYPRLDEDGYLLDSPFR